jgi:hypothetical protein
MQDVLSQCRLVLLSVVVIVLSTGVSAEDRAKPKKPDSKNPPATFTPTSSPLHPSPTANR